MNGKILDLKDPALKILRTQEEIRGMIDWMIMKKSGQQGLLFERADRYIKELQDALHFSKIPNFGSVYCWLTDEKSRQPFYYFSFPPLLKETIKTLQEIVDLS